MDYRKELIKMIDRFNIKSVEELREAEMRIIADSRFTMITVKKDYNGHINTLKRVKRNALKIDPNNIVVPKSDSEAVELKRTFEKCIIIFNGVCDAYIQLLNTLKIKSEGTAKVSYSEYKEIHNKVKFAKDNFNAYMHDMDIICTDFSGFNEEIDEDENLAGVEYMTYDSIK